MTSTEIALLAAFVPVWFLIDYSTSEPVTPYPRQMDLRDAQTELEEACERHEVPGAQLGLLRGSDRAVVVTGSVSPGGPSVEPSTSFHAGSLAKALTGSVVLDAARRGEIDLDVPCSEQAPGLWSDTPRALLQQTSGRANVLPDVDEDLEAFVARTGELPLVHETGRFSYCNAGWSVLDLLLRRRTGLSFEQAAVERLDEQYRFDMPPDAAQPHACLPRQGPVAVPASCAPAAAAAGATWWVTADQLLDLARTHLHPEGGPLSAQDVLALRTPASTLPGSTVFDARAMGWATWDRGSHQAFGWAGYTGGHRAFLRCFPGQDAAVVLLANGAGPLFGPPGGSAVFDELLPGLLDLLDVPRLDDPVYDAEPSAGTELQGEFGPISIRAVADPDRLELLAPAFGQPEPVRLERLGGNTFDVIGRPPGSTPLAFDGDILYFGPFALPRS